MASVNVEFFNEELMCHVFELHYDYVFRRGRLDFPLHNCCDMRGAIALFKRIDLAVKSIHTYVDDVPDTQYRRTNSGDWEAFTPP